MQEKVQSRVQDCPGYIVLWEGMIQGLYAPHPKAKVRGAVLFTSRRADVFPTRARALGAIKRTRAHWRQVAGVSDRGHYRIVGLRRAP